MKLADRKSLLKKAIVFTIISLIVVSMFIFKYAKILNIDNNAIMQIEHINSNIQRNVKLELENFESDEDIKVIENLTKEIYNDDVKLHYFTLDEEVHLILLDYIDDLYNFKNAIMYYRDTLDRDSLIMWSEKNYKLSSTTLNATAKYISNLTNLVITLQYVIGLQVLAIIILLILMLKNASIEARLSCENNVISDLDLLTGVYNISKCQDILETSIELRSENERAMVVLDIDDLRKTNEKFGREVGDKVIATFGFLIKQAVKVSPYETFLGRCGGDEFMIYFPVAEEKDIELYIDEIKFLCKEFNADESNEFKLNFSIGYSITNAKTRDFTNRQLFDIADKYMYQHKIVMKELLKNNKI